jgi:hypothetical protein
LRPIPFSVDAHVGEARATTLQLARGTVQTPLYMPVGTQGAVRAVPPDMLRDAGTQILLANTYHLSQRPGEDLVARHGGLHALRPRHLQPRGGLLFHLRLRALPRERAVPRRRRVAAARRVGARGGRAP